MAFSGCKRTPGLIRIYRSSYRAMNRACSPNQSSRLSDRNRNKSHTEVGRIWLGEGGLIAHRVHAQQEQGRRARDHSCNDSRGLESVQHSEFSRDDRIGVDMDRLSESDAMESVRTPPDRDAHDEGSIFSSFERTL